jgi:hypothetical protein
LRDNRNQPKSQSATCHVDRSVYGLVWFGAALSDWASHNEPRLAQNDACDESASSAQPCQWKWLTNHCSYITLSHTTKTRTCRASEWLCAGSGMTSHRGKCILSRRVTTVPGTISCEDVLTAECTWYVGCGGHAPVEIEVPAAVALPLQ